jgi:membrane protein involved in colicin uptake
MFQEATMKDLFSISSAAAAVAVAFAISSCSTQDEMASKPAAAPAGSPAKAEAKAESKAKAETTTAKAESKGEAKGDAKAEAKAKAEKARGDIGLLDTEKNYLILVTKEGKLITLDYDAKTKATQIDPTPSKVADIGLGSSATVEYTKQGDKNLAKSVEFTPAKGGD